MIEFFKDEEENKTVLYVPTGIRYMSEWTDFSLNFFEGPYIIDKQIPGCGFTEYCLTNNDDIILCSPRRILLDNKEEQHPGEIHYAKNELEFDPNVDSNRASSSKDDIVETLDMKQKMKEKLANYICLRDIEKKPIKIIVTFDSFRHVKEFLSEMGNLGRFKIVVDEFQSIFIDSRFKASTEFDFYSQLQTVTNPICFVSATPMINKYLKQLDYFKDIPYFELDWGTKEPGRVITPELKIRKTSSIISECKAIIQSYLDGKFMMLANPLTGEPVQSREAVIYLNSVNDILKLIKGMSLTPDQVNILCSDNPNNRKKLKKKLGVKYQIGSVPLKGQPHKMFTFCTRTVYLGADFYSTNARTFVLSDANIDSLAVDISLDLPQILGRQRLIENPWKNHAEFYFKNLGIDKNQSEEIFKKIIKEKDDNTYKLLKNFELETDPKTKQLLAIKYESDIVMNKYLHDFVSVNYVKGDYVLVYNNLVKIAEQRAYDIQQIDYKDRFVVFNAIKDYYKNNVSFDKIAGFVEKLRDTSMGHISDRLKLLCETDEFTDDEKKLIAQQVSEKFDLYYNLVGPEVCKGYGYNITLIKNKVRDLSIPALNVKNEFLLTFQVGKRYTNKDAKNAIKEIYERLGILTKTGKTTDLNEFFNIKPIKFFDSSSGKWIHGIEILGTK